jgi:Flp pilus assembly protein TadD
VRPEDSVVLNDLGWNLRASDPARALSLVSLAARVAPQSTQIMDTLAWLKFQLHDIPDALALLQHAHALDNNDAEIGYHFAIALDASGRRAEAKKLLQSVVTRKSAFDDRAKAKQLLAAW